jgi:hypothetical protein
VTRIVNAYETYDKEARGEKEQDKTEKA